MSHDYHVFIYHLHHLCLHQKAIDEHLAQEMVHAQIRFMLRTLNRIKQ